MKPSLLKLLIAVTLVTPAFADNEAKLLLESGPINALFQTLDGDDNKGLSQAEWNQLYPKAVRKEKGFALTDLNQDGTVTLAEFSTPPKNKEFNQVLKAKIIRAEVFLHIDANNDGLVTRTEIAVMWKPGTPLKEINAIWKKVSSSESVNLLQWITRPTLPSIERFKQALKIRARNREIATKLDVNANGVITRGEFNMLEVLANPEILDQLWLKLTKTEKGATAPEEITVEAFVESAFKSPTSDN